MHRVLAAITLAAAILVAAPAAVPPVLAQDQQEAAVAGVGPVGIVTRVAREARAERAQQAMALKPSDPVANEDRLTTGPGGRLQVALLDEGTLLLGENAELVVDDLVLGEDETALKMYVDGAFRLISGALRHAEGTQIVTPVATIGIRGTDVWGGVIDGAFSVFLVEGEVSVTTDAGTVILDTPGTGTTVPAADAPPTEPETWSDGKVRRAVATVTFP
ncbi:FecR domain-containing protein [Caenispirillum salinarum]|uniref:FecR family protein n=1 Tax=Caenispirillum salinarum TaxID=859058 RepID=UPI00384B090F